MHELHEICITAHTGALRTQANTLRSVQTCLGLAGVDCIEVDLRFLPCGTPALGHNWVNARSPKLAAVFELMQGCETRINLDMKESTHVGEVIKLVDAYGLQGRVLMSGLSKSDCETVRHCGLPYYLNGTDVSAANEVDALGVNIHHSICSEDLVAEAHKAGLLVSVWTVDRPRAMRKMLRLRVDNITTKKPDKLLEIMSYAI